jgi:predicted nuclease of predicted toxin-antitoxin system
MRFLADENIPRASLHALRAAGHDVLSIAESSPGMADAEVLRLGIEQDRTLITFDRDFGALVFQTSTAAEPGIVLFRLVPVDPQEPASVLLALIEHADIRFAGRITVIGRDSVRQRMLPGADDTTSDS